MTKNLLVLLGTILVLLIGAEVVLNIFDPWGVHYFDDLASVWDNTVAHPDRIDVISPGVYRFSNWTVTELEGYTRAVPDNMKGSCKVVFVGDSVTWGHGVNDKDTWVNLVAAQLPETNVINAGFEGYNSENVKGTLKDFPDAKLLVYLIIGNDAEPTTGLLRQTRASMMKKYLTFFFKEILKTDSNRAANADTIATSDSTIYNRFRADIEAMSHDKRVVFIGFDEPLSNSLKPAYHVNTIPLYTNHISLADPHPSARGHQQVAESILPIVQKAIENQCYSQN